MNTLNKKIFLSIVITIIWSAGLVSNNTQACWVATVDCINTQNSFNNNWEVNPYIEKIDQKLQPKLKIATQKLQSFTPLQLQILQNKLSKISTKYSDSTKVVPIIHYLYFEIAVLMNNIDGSTSVVDKSSIEAIFENSNQNAQYWSIASKEYIFILAKQEDKVACNSYKSWSTSVLNRNWLYGTYNIEFCWEYIKVKSPEWVLNWWYSLYKAQTLELETSCDSSENTSTICNTLTCRSTDFWLCVKSKSTCQYFDMDAKHENSSCSYSYTKNRRGCTERITACSVQEWLFQVREWIYNAWDTNYCWYDSHDSFMNLTTEGNRNKLTVYDVLPENLKYNWACK